MADDLPFYAPRHHTTVPQRSPKPGEEVWRLKNDQGRIVTCELRDDSRVGLGWDVQLLHDGKLVFSKRWPFEEGARWVAQCFRQDYARAAFTEAPTTAGTNPVESKTAD